MHAVSLEPSGGRLTPLTTATGFEAYFHELDAWTEYWDVYHPESNGRYYFGSGDTAGLLELIVPRESPPPIFSAWKQRALGRDEDGAFGTCATSAPTDRAIAEYDALMADILVRHFGDPTDDAVRCAFLRAMHRFATDQLAPASERYERIADDDPRKRTSGRHTIDADMMWFIWALVLEAAQINDAASRGDLRGLMLAGVVVGCSANFGWLGHRRTRAEYYEADEATERLLLERGLKWSLDFDAAAAEMHLLYRIREGRSSESSPAPFPA